MPLTELCRDGINLSGKLIEDCCASANELFDRWSNELERRNEGGTFVDGSVNEVLDLCSNLGLSEEGNCGLWNLDSVT